MVEMTASDALWRLYVMPDMNGAVDGLQLL